MHKIILTLALLVTATGCLKELSEPQLNLFETDTDSGTDSDTETDTAPPVDEDGDGSTVDNDCNDLDASVHPGATEVCNAVDDDCDGGVDVNATDASTWYDDQDEDGFGDVLVSQIACDQPSGFVDNPDDCDDDVVAVNPDATELCNGTDDDCDSTIDVGAADAPIWYDDNDGDGFGDETGGVVACANPGGKIATGGDCDDSTVHVYPGADEAPDDHVDNDCDGDVDQADTNVLPCLITVSAVDVNATTMRAIFNGPIVTDGLTLTPVPNVAYIRLWAWDVSTSVRNRSDTYAGDGIDHDMLLPRSDWAAEAESSAGTGSKKSFLDFTQACVADELLVRIEIDPVRDRFEVAYVGP